MQLLKARQHSELLALTPGASNTLENIPMDVLVDSAAKILSEYWRKGSVLIVIGALGAVTRLVAPLLRGKEQDPAVIVLDANGLHVVPLIGGHQAGAEQLAQEIAADIGGQAVMTGDSTSQERLALDSFGRTWGWQRSQNLKEWKKLMLAQAKGEKLAVFQSSGSKLWQLSAAARKSFNEFHSSDSLVSNQLNIGPFASSFCSWHPPTLWVGVGCERNSSLNLLERALEDSLSQSGLAKESIAGIATIDKKNDEKAFLTLAKKERWAMRFFSAQALAGVEVPNPSQAVQDVMGTPSVAEAAALLAAKPGSKLLLSKRVFSSQINEMGAITIAISESEAPFAPQEGELHLLGSGPGDLALLTQDARFALSKAVVWVGYWRYLDILEPLRRPDQIRIDGELTFEVDRCRKALELAQQGAVVALVSSGDSGIYGMAGLALELWLRLTPAERPYFQVHPGISAFQIAAAKVGAPLMQDFCTISLSDRLTPWEKIEARIRSAALGDFVIAFYNPRSKNRDWHLAKAIEVLLEHRPLNTPVVIARQLGRVEEKIDFFSLEDFPVQTVDMLSLILVGNSSTRIEDGKIVTPRGYSIVDSA